MKVFRKLVRDRIPKILAQDGEKAITRVLDDAEFVTALEHKLLEEVQEMRQMDNADERKREIADIYEVLDALIRAYGFSKEEIMALKEKKRQERGGFEKRLFLEGMEQPAMEPKLFVSMKAFVVHDGNVLILRESPQDAERTNVGRYDVVGGRVKPGQRFDESLLREIREETGLTVRIGKPFHVDEWRPVVRDEPWQIVATFFECFAESGAVTLSDEHDDYQWIEPKAYRSYPLIENLLRAFDAYLTTEKTAPR